MALPLSATSLLRAFTRIPPSTIVAARNIVLYTSTFCRRHISTSSSRNGSILYSAVCVERLPIISPPLSEIEDKFSKMFGEIEFENSYLSDFEMRLAKEAQAAKAKQEGGEEETKSTDAETVTALDLEDKWEAELKAFSAASTETEADRTGNPRTTDRKLDSTLYLLVKQKIEGKDHWVLPQAEWQDGETLKQTAEHVLSSVCGGVHATILGKAPAAVAKFDPPLNDDSDKQRKLFFFKAWYRGGQLEIDGKEASDFVWVTKEELKEFCFDRYRTQLKKLIID